MDSQLIPQAGRLGRTAIFRLPAVVELIGVSRATIWRWVAENLFPAPVRLGPRAVGWRRTDVEAWLASRPLHRTVQSTAAGTVSGKADPIGRSFAP